MAEKIQVLEGDALLVLDLQNDFFTGGAIPVPGAEAVVPAVNRLFEMLPRAVVSQVWHPRGHVSFASSYPGRKPFETISSGSGEHMLWPDHCLAGRHGADLRADLNTTRVELMLRRGNTPGLDVTSALLASDRRTGTGLLGYLQERKIRRLFVAGLLVDFSVRATALDARRSGLDVVAVEDAMRGLNVRGSLEKAWLALAEVGVRRVMSEDLVLSS